MLTAVATGYETRGSGFVPTFDVMVNGRKMGELAGGFPYMTPAAAGEASVRVLAYLEEKGCFPNLCAEF